MAAYTHFMDGEDNLLLAETMTLNKAIDVAKDCSVYEVLFEIDNKTLVKMINDK